MKVSASAVCLIIALVLFFLAAFAAWWPSASPQPYWHPRFIAAGLFFWALSQAAA